MLSSGKHVLSGVLIIAGLLLIIYPPWAEFNVQLEQWRLAKIQQKNAGRVLIQQDAGYPEVPSTFNSALLAISAIDLSVLVAPGTSPAQLKKAPGWYEESSLPGQGNTAIAAHRTTYGAWFRRLDRLKAGDSITLTWAGKTYAYQVQKVFQVAPNDWSVIEPCGYPALTLTTCHPEGSDRQRLVVRATMMEVKYDN